ncbi:hypothetical protein WN944_006365 [Citrus x changshan-huyou]|uniref:Uncharacterized protein n=1 Tax=Citrus x changshan-huyou TaxID=2935761 RepID=A0AAP0ML73_9ROSI
MSTAKCTPAGITKTLIEEISDEEGKPHSKKPQRLHRKTRLMRKKRNIPQFQLATCYLRAKVTELATLVPCAFHHLPLLRYVQKEAYLKADTLEIFSHLSATHALEALARNQAEQSLIMVAHIEMFCKVIERPCENRRTRACFDENQPH